MTRYILVLSFFLLSCHQSNNNKAVSPITSTERKDTTLSLDSLTNPNSYSYLTNLPLRQVANLILKDSIRILDNKVTFDCMDSISSGIMETRNFYYPVFLKIVNKADGALSEAVGGYMKAYIEDFPKEFIERTNQMSDQEFQSFVSYTGEELYNTYNTTQGDFDWENKIIKKCSDCDSFQLDKIKKFIKLAIAARKEDVEQFK